MKIMPNDLEKNGYRLLDTLNHAYLKSFLNEKSGQKGVFLYIMIISLVLPIPIISYFFTYTILTDKISFLQGIVYSSLGIGLVFLFIPIHELLHAVALQLIGAKNISFFSNFKKFYFATISDKSVLSLKEFKVVALFPFLFVLIMVIILIPLVTLPWKFTVLCFLATHTIFCSGDFTLLNYMQNHSRKGIVTFDDKAKKESYFFIKKEEKIK